MHRVTLGQLAVRFGCELHGDPDATVDHVADLQGAGPGALAFFANARYRAQLTETRATAVVIELAELRSCPVAALVAKNAHATFARMAEVLHPPPAGAPGVHPSAVLGSDSVLDASASIGALCVVGARARIGARVIVGPGCVLGEDVTLADDVRLVARVTLCDGVQIGARSIVHPGAVIGADGFGFAAERGAWVKVPQVGSVRIGEDVDIGANATIDCGAIGDTVIEDGVKLDNQIQVGHNTRIGAHTIIAGCAVIAGSAVIGKHCQIAGSVGINGHISICDNVVLTAQSMVVSSITEPGVYSSGIPIEAAREWRRIVARIKQLDALAKRLRAAEQRLGISSEDKHSD